MRMNLRVPTAAVLAALVATGMGLHTIRPAIEAFLATNLGCAGALDDCGAAGRMLALWAAGMLPVLVGFILATAIPFSRSVRDGGLLLWLITVLAASVSSAGGVPASLWICSAALLLGCCFVDGRLPVTLVILALFWGAEASIDTVRGVLVPLAGMNLVPRAQAAELSIILKDFGETAEFGIKVSTWLSIAGALMVLRAIACPAAWNAR